MKVLLPHAGKRLIELCIPAKYSERTEEGWEVDVGRMEKWEQEWWRLMMEAMK